MDMTPMCSGQKAQALVPASPLWGVFGVLQSLLDDVCYLSEENRALEMRTHFTLLNLPLNSG